MLLLAVVALHLAVIEWMSGYMGFSGLRNTEQGQADSLISASLHPPAPPAKVAAPPLARPAKPVESTPEPVAPEPAATPTADPVSADAGVAASSKPGMEASGTRVDTPVQAASSPGAGLTASAQPSWRTNLPPSARLSYRIQAFKQGQNVFGSGLINWKNEGSNYLIEGESSLLFITVFRFRSEGTIDSEYGISPILYAETRFRKPETNTHFHRERNLVSFSASTRSYPRKGGEQDRSSVVWQLAGIGRHDAEQFQPGVKFPVFVAGARDAETWYFEVVGLEDIDVAAGKMRTWHLARKPRTGSYDQALDIWLAPRKDWYPVRLRHTEKNGDYLDMSLSEIEVAPAR